MRTYASAASTAGVTTACSILLIEPSPTSTAQKSARSSCTDRFDIRNLPVQIATIAVRRADRRLLPAQRDARARPALTDELGQLVLGDVRLDRRRGRSTTWWRRGAGSSP